MGVQDIAAIIAAIGGGALLRSPFEAAWRWAKGSAEREANRVGDLEQLVEVLRRAIDKVRLREDALAQVLGLLIFGLRHIEDLSPPIADAIERAIEILEGAKDQLSRLDDPHGGSA